MKDLSAIPCDLELESCCCCDDKHPRTYKSGKFRASHFCHCPNPNPNASGILVYIHTYIHTTPGKYEGEESYCPEWELSDITSYALMSLRIFGLVAFLVCIFESMGVAGAYTWLKTIRSDEYLAASRKRLSKQTSRNNSL